MVKALLFWENVRHTNTTAGTARILASLDERQRAKFGSVSEPGEPNFHVHRNSRERQKRGTPAKPAAEGPETDPPPTPPGLFRRTGPTTRTTTGKTARIGRHRTAENPCEGTYDGIDGWTTR
jgi:hypothetical protein